MSHRDDKIKLQSRQSLAIKHTLTTKEQVQWFVLVQCPNLELENMIFEILLVILFVFVGCENLLNI